MSDHNLSAYQALIAFMAEAKKSGVDVEEIASKAQAEIMGNAIYCSIGPTQKVDATQSLTKALNEVNELPSLKNTFYKKDLLL